MLFGRDNFIHQVWADDFENHGFFFDEPTPHWVRNPWGHNLEGTPWSPELRRELLRWQNEPVEQWKGDATSLKKYLDSMTYEQYLTNVRKLPVEVARYADPLLSASIGLGSDVLSAYAAFYDEFPGFTGLSPSGILFIRDHKMANVPGDFHSFPGGNDGIMRCIVKALIPGAIAGGSAFADIHNGRLQPEALDRPNAPVRMRPSTTVIGWCTTPAAPGAPSPRRSPTRATTVSTRSVGAPSSGPPPIGRPSTRSSTCRTSIARR
jgi:spermidine dehydrogenase